MLYFVDHQRSTRLVRAVGHEAVPLVFELLDAEQLCRNGHHLVDRDCEANSLGAGPHGDVQPDHLAVDVHQRPAGVAGIDAGVGLDQIVVGLRVAHLNVAAQSADDTARDGVLVSKGVAQRDYGLAFHQVGRGADLDSCERLGSGDFDQRQVALGVAGNELGGELTMVVECDLNPADVGHHVVVGDDVAPFVDDDAGAHAVNLPRRFAAGGGLHGGLHDLLALDVDDRRLRGPDGADHISHSPRGDLFADRSIDHRSRSANHQINCQARADSERRARQSARSVGH